MRLEQKLAPLTNYPLDKSSTGRLLFLAATYHMFPSSNVELNNNDLRELGERAKDQVERDYTTCIFQAASQILPRLGYEMPLYESPSFTNIATKYQLLSTLTQRSEMPGVKQEIDKGLRSSIRGFWEDPNAQRIAQDQEINVQLVGSEDLFNLNPSLSNTFDYCSFKKKTDKGLIGKEVLRLSKILTPSSHDLQAIGKVSKTQLSGDDLRRYAFENYYPKVLESGMDFYEYNRQRSKHFLEVSEEADGETQRRKLGGPLNEILADPFLIDAAGFKVVAPWQQVNYVKNVVNDTLNERLMVPLERIDQKTEDLHAVDEKDRAAVYAIRGGDEAGFGEVRIQAVPDNYEGEFGRIKEEGRRGIKAHYQRSSEISRDLRPLVQPKRVLREPFLNLCTAFNLSPQDIIENYK